MMPAVLDEIEIAVGSMPLEGSLVVPARAEGLVIFVHGSGSSRFSPRNIFVARQLQQNGLATLLFDLLTPSEASDRANVFDIPLLGERVIDALEWSRTEARLAGLRIGLFGASTGAAAALVAAAAMPEIVAAVVSRGGRPDLAGAALGEVRAPTLLIVGGEDHQVLQLNRTAQRAMRCVTRLDVVPGATHLFEEAGTLEQVVAAANNWFSTYLAGAPR